MLSMAALKSERYYLDLAREDYYLKGGEPPGVWLGAGAARFGLSGKVDNAHFQSLYRGFSPDGSNPLAGNARRATHHPGWDLTFSAPKSVSVLWSQLGPERKQAIQEAHLAAVSSAIQYLEARASFTKRGGGGVQIERVMGLVVAAFEHGTSRAQDPQLHTHCITFNVAPRADGTTGTLVGRALFRAKMAAGALYRAELAHRLHAEFGLAIQPTSSAFELGGVPEELVRRFSSRRTEILQAMSRLGLSGAQSAAKLNLTTRTVKAHIARELLFEDWQRTGASCGFTWAEVDRLFHLSVHRVPELGADFYRAIVDTLTARRSFFRETDFVRLAAVEALRAGHLARDMAPGCAEFLRNAQDVIRLGEFGGVDFFSTVTARATAEALLAESILGRQARRPGLRSDVVQRAIQSVELASGRGLSPAGRLAVLDLTRSSESVRQASGVATDEWARVIRAASIAFEKRGHVVVTILPFAAEAKARQTKTGNPAFGVRGFLSAVRTKGAVESFRIALSKDRGFHPLRGLLRHAEAIRNPWLRLNRRTVVVLESPEQIATSHLLAITQAVRAAGATLLVMGDSGHRLEPERIPQLEMTQGVTAQLAQTEAAVRGGKQVDAHPRARDELAPRPGPELTRQDGGS